MTQLSTPNYSDADLGGHTHIDKRGYVHWCFHKTKNLLAQWQFWLGLTLGFPVEHALWDYVPPFCYLTHWMGL